MKPENNDEVLAAYEREPASGKRGVDIRIAAWWFEAGLVLGFGLWIVGLYLSMYWLLAVGFGCIVATFLAERRRQRKDPVAQAAQLLLAGRPDDARATIRNALRRRPGDPKLRAMLETMERPD